MNHKRPAFTLIEMLVAMALTLFIMVIISQAFVTALEVFSGLKGIGDLQSNLRTASTLMQSDLAQDHFEGKRKLSDPVGPNEVQTLTNVGLPAGQFALSFGAGTTGAINFAAPASVVQAALEALPTIGAGNVVVSGPPGGPHSVVFQGALGNRKLPLLGVTNAGPTFVVVGSIVGGFAGLREGFFSLRIGPNVNEGNDADGLPSVRGPLAGSFSDALYFTVKLRGNRRDRFMSWRLPAGYGASPLIDPANGPNFFNQPADALFQDQALTYNAQWAEVAWYLARTGTTDEPLNPASSLGTPLYALYRAHYLLVPNNGPANANINGTTLNATIGAYLGVSCFQRPAPGTTLYFNSPADVTTSNSRAMISRGEPIITNAVITPQQLAANSSLVLSNVVSFQVRLMPIGGSGFTLDYWSMAPVNQPLPSKSFDSATPNTGVRALQIIIRAWDPNSQQTRQITIVQDM